MKNRNKIKLDPGTRALRIISYVFVSIWRSSVCFHLSWLFPHLSVPKALSQKKDLDYYQKGLL